VSTTLSLRIDEDTKERLEALAKRSRRSKSFLAAEAIASYVEAESWQLDETAAGVDAFRSEARESAPCSRCRGRMVVPRPKRAHDREAHSPRR
jgi:predicted transcriptional regulator